MTEYFLKPIEKPSCRGPIIDLPDARPFATGNGPHDYLCGRCRNVLFRKIEVPRAQPVTVICGKCRGANLMTPTN